MFNKKLIPKICDWGLCSNDSKYSQTQAYIAPEQFMKSDSKDKIDLKKVDSWSLGIVLYYLLHKKTPFTNEQLKEILKTGTAIDIPFRPDVPKIA